MGWFPVTLFCLTCGRGKTFTTIGPTTPCETCQTNEWRPADNPKLPYELNQMDRRLLKTLRIEADES